MRRGPIIETVAALGYLDANSGSLVAVVVLVVLVGIVLAIVLPITLSSRRRSSQASPWVQCPTCGATLSADHQFCGRCGASLGGKR